MHTKRFLPLLLALCLLPFAAQADAGVFYEIFPASFYDENGDGMGDLNGITRQLDYLEALGVEGLWLMPIHPSPSYHKYDVTDYMAIDPAYGTLEDMRALADALHARGMDLIIDLVLNHTSSQHGWFISAAESLAAEPCGQAVCASAPFCRAHNPHVGYYHFSTEPNGAGWHALADAPGWHYLGHFSPDMPDLNLENAAVQAEIEAICAFWLTLGVDGFRLDAVPHYFEENVERNNAFVAWLMDTVRAINPDAYVVGEAWKDAGSIARYYESGISSLFNFPFSGAEGAIVKAIRSKNGAAFAKKAADWQAVWGAFPGASDAPFLSNHDNARIAGTLMRDEQKLKMAASLCLTLPGTPFLYYGEEIGMTGSGRDENKRLPMPWGTDGLCLPPPMADMESASLGSVREQLADEDSLLSHYRALLALRKAYPALRDGVLAAVDTGQQAVCAYTLSGAAGTVAVFHNMGKEEIQVAWAGHEIAALLEGAAYDGAVLTLPPLSSAVLADR